MLTHLKAAGAPGTLEPEAFLAPTTARNTRGTLLRG